MTEYVRTSDLNSLILKYKTGSWKDLAENSGISGSYIRKIRQGTTQYNTLRVADRLLTALGLNVSVEIEVLDIRIHGSGEGEDGIHQESQ